VARWVGAGGGTREGVSLGGLVGGGLILGLRLLCGWFQSSTIMGCAEIRQCKEQADNSRLIPPNRGISTDPWVEGAGWGTAKRGPKVVELSSRTEWRTETLEERRVESGGPAVCSADACHPWHRWSARILYLRWFSELKGGLHVSPTLINPSERGDTIE